MGVRTNDIFGSTGGAEPATPGTYGEIPNGYRLPADTRLGLVRLQVADLARSLTFYEGVLGMRPVQRAGPRVVLSAQEDDRPLVELNERNGARPASHRGGLGLYHFAILLPDRASLGRFVRHLGEINVQAGAADHLVSEALYLQDPDNLGIEVYYDRPRHVWQRLGRELVMATDPLDVAGLLAATHGERWTGMPADASIGHVHLHVGSLAESAAFFSEALGFDRTVWHYPGALFLGAGGYHHYLGTNTWAGQGALPPQEQDARLLEWTVELPDVASLAAAEASLARHGYASERTDDSLDSVGLVAHDPWGTPVRLRVRGTP